MSVYFISDLHIGHKNILQFSPERGGTTVDEHDHWIVDQWNSRINKRDVVYVLGDVCFDKKKLPLLNEMKGLKFLVRGNHDTFALSEYTPYFQNIHGLHKRYGFWMSHAPIHPDELRGRINVHGHVHHQTIPDSRYVNVCVEACNGVPISLDEIREIKNEHRT